MIALIDEPIDTQLLLERAQSPDSGAVLMFLGVSRRWTYGRETTLLHYDAYREMAEKQLDALCQQAMERWQLHECLLVHRLGNVPLGEASVAVVVASGHRKAAFEAGQWLIDTLKECVPIWKQEHWADGTKQWVEGSRH